MLSNSQLTKEFHDMIKEVYPDIELQQVRDIVYSPWVFARKQIESGEVPEIRFKYFGTMTVPKRYALSEMKGIKKRFDAGVMDHAEYFRLKKILEKVLKRHGEDETKFKKHPVLPTR